MSFLKAFGDYKKPGGRLSGFMGRSNKRQFYEKKMVPEWIFSYCCHHLISITTFHSLFFLHLMSKQWRRLVAV